MIFNSLEFIIFFIITTTIYFVIPKKVQKYFLILTSLAFFLYHIPWHVLILISVVLINYFAGIFIENASGIRKRFLFVFTVIFNLAILFTFKYFYFFNSNLSELAKLVGWNYSISTFSLIIPLGLSFYTFKILSYVIEVYRENIKAERKIDVFALYILMYPELLAGPIDRPQNLIPQLFNSNEFEYERITNGLKLIAWGFFQKCVIADRLAPLVGSVYDNPHVFAGPAFVFATFLFAVQIYCDFSAYSDIAIGIGEVLGFKFMKNFDRPYFSKSISEFWRRWHISLSFWFRDYLFLPIAYSVVRRLKNRHFFKISPTAWSYIVASIITMFLVGLWHGASWNYIIWGLLIGIYLVFSFITKNIRNRLLKITRLVKLKKLHSLLSGIFTFSLICITWIFFRAGTLDDAVYIITHLHTGVLSYLKELINIMVSFNFSGKIAGPITFGMDLQELKIALIATMILFIVHVLQGKIKIINYISGKPLLIRWSLYLILFLAILFLGKFETRQFIYSQF